MAQSDLDAADQLRSKGFMTAVEFKRRQSAGAGAEAGDQRPQSAACRAAEPAHRNQLHAPAVADRDGAKVQALRNDLATAEQRIAEINGRRAYVIRAPTAGRISTLQATRRTDTPIRSASSWRSSQSTAVLQAELLVPARAIGFVEVGQPVRILYDAFPYQHFGTYTRSCR